MKELEPKLRDRIENVAENEIKREFKHLGSIHPDRGHTLYQVNTVTGEITEAVFEKQDIDFMAAERGEIFVHQRVIKQENCIYIPALNIRNVKKVLKRGYR